MRFTDPRWALLFVPLVAGLVLSWRHFHGIAKFRKRFAFFVRFVMCGCVIVALMGPQSYRRNNGVAVMFLLDRSDSVSEPDRKAAEQFVDTAMRSLGSDDVAGVIAFGAAPMFESASGGKRPLGRLMAKIDPSASDLAAAMRLAAATFPEGKARRIVVLSDGNETRGDAQRAAEAEAVEGIDVDFVGLGSVQLKDEVSILQTQAPSERRVDQPFQLRLLVESSSDQKGTIVVERNGVAVDHVDVDLIKGKSWVTVDQKLTEPGFYRYRASLEAPNDTDRRNNIGATFVNVRGRPKVLVLQSDTGKRELVDALTKQGVSVDLFGPEGIPVRAEELQPYDAVILNDINAFYFSDQQMRLMESAVKDSGIGLAMIGGENSFLPGGWYGTTVADALPVDLNIRQRKSFPSTTVLIV
ncbi:MAG TPA: VWA domain-containing protein, partial [Fimbriimonadaceae bacterium]|nr:VWA domain-containing protein [Fimbriimonadaceae bacterium]